MPQSPRGEKLASSSAQFGADPITEDPVRNNVDSRNSEDQLHQSGLKIVLTIVALTLAVFCVGLDDTIIATAIPRIVDEFKSVSDIGWYASSYLLPYCAFQLVYGKLYTELRITRVFYACLLLFEVGSIVSATAPSSKVLIIGRAISGLGASGVFSGALIAVNHVVPYHRRPLGLASLGTTYGLAGVVAPLIGGAFTDGPGWRWCFWLNLPLGGVTIAILLLLLRGPALKQELKKRSFLNLLQVLDVPGTITLIGAIVSLLLALEWAGSQYAWDSARVIALLTLAGTLAVVFVLIQVFTDDDRSTIPLHISKRRNVAFSFIFSFFFGGAYFSILYFLPLWFQAIQGVSAVSSGVHMLPLILAEVLGIWLSSSAISLLGPYMPWVWMSVVFMSIGAGLLYTMNATEAEGKWIGYQIIFGFGTGCGWQMPQTAVQAVLQLDEIPIATAVTALGLLMGGSVFASVGQNIFSNSLVGGIDALRIPNLSGGRVLEVGATMVSTLVSQQDLEQVRDAYNVAITRVFRLACIMASLMVLGAVGMEWIQVKKEKEPSAAPSEGPQENEPDASPSERLQEK